MTNLTGETLQIYRVTRVHMGAYLCIAYNGVPPSVSRRILLHVHCKYTFCKTFLVNMLPFMRQYFFPPFPFILNKKLIGSIVCNQMKVIVTFFTILSILVYDKRFVPGNNVIVLVVVCGCQLAFLIHHDLFPFFV